MKRDLKWMLLGIFLGVSAIWCLLFGRGSVLFGILGGYALPIVAVICFGTGFSGYTVEEEQPPPDDSSQTNHLEDQ
ncbi:hypothetical protein ACTQ33_03195 [Candidatus Avoscillospira sp. LCP25S3_F1]|uniref:hypothetical protein n=1 Tax=Candidatus Avoscillospira sp. LCP25S3_F1 TaxID=3438825 RepID=UPI003F8FAB63